MRRTDPAPESLQQNFNPRTPHGVRQAMTDVHCGCKGISTHAPLTGCDTSAGWPSLFRYRFQPTHPSRGATVLTPYRARPMQFQPTHPSRGATIDSTCYVGGLVISTHAPLTGCDEVIDSQTGEIKQFQSTHPVRGATFRLRVLPVLSAGFQSTHPVRGATMIKAAPAGVS